MLLLPTQQPTAQQGTQAPRADALGTAASSEQLGSTTHGAQQFTLYTTTDLQTPGQPFSNTPLFREGDTTQEGLDNNMLIKEHGGRDRSQERQGCKYVRTPWPRKKPVVLIWKGDNCS